MTLRAGSSAAVFAVVAGVTLLLLGDAVLKGAWPTAARVAGVGALVVWVAWMLLVRPSIRVLPDRAVVVNVGRITEVPWARVVDVRRRLQLILELDDDRHVEAWGSPFVSRRNSADDPAAQALRSAWMSASRTDSTGVVTRRPDAVALTVGAAALALLVVTQVASG
ncbi:MAG: hypothetical protein ABI566_06665 [Pseudolysinimonas sp.]